MTRLISAASAGSSRMLSCTDARRFREPEAFGPKGLVNGCREQPAPSVTRPSAVTKVEVLDRRSGRLLHLMRSTGLILAVPLFGDGGHALKNMVTTSSRARLARPCATCRTTPDIRTPA